MEEERHLNPRLMRLQADYERIRDEFVGHPYVSVEPASQIRPPERYNVTYRVPGLRWNSRGQCAEVAHQHVAEIYLHAEYPREKPKCVLKTPIWHPNFGGYICIGDHWAAGETLVDVIVQIGDMLQYRVYNPDSPLNLPAARWAIQHRGMLPVGSLNILQAEPEIALDGVPGRMPLDDLGISLAAAPLPENLEITIEDAPMNPPRSAACDGELA